MSFQSLVDVFAYVQAHDELTSTEVSVLLALANHTDRKTGIAYPSLKTLHQTTKFSRRAIQYALRTLEEKNLLQAILEPSMHTSPTYRLLIPHRYPRDSSKRRSAPGARGGAPGAPYPVIEPEGEKPYTRDIKDGSKSGMIQFLTPGSRLWRDMEKTVSERERNGATSSD